MVQGAQDRTALHGSANPQANGQTEVTNRTILHHLKTRIDSKGSWADELPGVLWAYRTTPRTATGETPFCLVYGTEAIIPAEIGEESQRVAMYDPEANQQERSFDLTMIEERRDGAYARILHHKGLMMRSQGRRVRPRQLQTREIADKEFEPGACERPSTRRSNQEPVKGHQQEVEPGACERPVNEEEGEPGACKRPDNR
ncbi:UNVERIFIED_CONTAM: hypothetical protein Sindi_2982600 [Sesamum indicum]